MIYRWCLVAELEVNICCCWTAPFPYDLVLAFTRACIGCHRHCKMMQSGIQETYMCALRMVFTSTVVLHSSCLVSISCITCAKTRLSVFITVYHHNGRWYKQWRGSSSEFIHETQVWAPNALAPHCASWALQLASEPAWTQALIPNLHCPQSG